MSILLDLVPVAAVLAYEHFISNYEVVKKVNRRRSIAAHVYGISADAIVGIVGIVISLVNWGIQLYTNYSKKK